MTAEYESMAAQSFLMKETAPLSQNLAAVASAGLEALEYLDRGERAPAEWKAKAGGAPSTGAASNSAQLLLMIVPSVQKLVEAAGK